MNPTTTEKHVDRRDLLVAGGLAIAGLVVADESATSTLPAGVRPVWDIEKAHRETTATRERICLNGLWRWQPAAKNASNVPDESWGFFKVPAFWPGNNSYIQDDCQALYAHAKWKDVDRRATSAAWYEREISIPMSWKGRRIVLSADCVNSFASVFIDGKEAGEIRFPGGAVEITAACKPGAKHTLAILVAALPLKGVLLSYSDTNSAREVKGTVDRRGLCGDVYLSSEPAATRIADVKIDTSVRKGELKLAVRVDALTAEMQYSLRIGIRDGDRAIREFTSQPFKKGDLVDSRIEVIERWKPGKFWDLHTPHNQFEARVSLMGSDDKILDTYHPIRFGFLEFWIDGRDFYLNGSRIYLSAVPLDNAQISARTASYEGAKETLKRLQSFGINFVYTHNYGCEPGSHVSFAEVLRAADDLGMLVAFSQPHFGQYEWKAADADKSNGYARHAEYYVRTAQNHPSVVAYSMSHNATGYAEDMNPDLIDGIKDPRAGDTWSTNNAALAQRAEAIVKHLDPDRIVYHHSSGNLGSMHTVNFYLNFVPIQEMSDWFEHWATRGVKPVFLCEYGVPFTWDWTMYRGWYKGERSFGSAKVPWEFCLAEWNAQFLGDRAYRITDAEKRNLRWESGQFQAGNLWHRWDYPTSVGSSDFDDRQIVIGRYITNNWRAHRTWGISANSPWEYAAFWKPRPGVDRRRRELKVDWESLQRPGFSPDYVQPRQGWMSIDLEQSDWLPTPASEALVRNNRPLLAYIAGRSKAFTSQDHIFRPGETVEKQLVVINNSRQTMTCECEWSLSAPGSPGGAKKATIGTGEQERLPIDFDLPEKLAPGTYELAAAVRFANGELQKDSFVLHVVPPQTKRHEPGRIALLDPKGETGKALGGTGVKFERVEGTGDLSRFDVLIVGKEALSADGPGPDVSRVRDGLKVIVFEQTAQVLERRFGFRVAEYGLREVFRRVPGHPLLAGLDADHFRDWRGEATISSPRLQYTMRPRHGPTIKWCGIDVSRPWRCGCRGNVASVLIEKPARGDFLPIVDGGYALQYCPFLQFHDGKGLVLFCQLDVSGRSETEPAAEILVNNILRHVSDWTPSPRRQVMFVGDAAGRKYLESAGLSPADYPGDGLTPDRILIVGPGGGKRLAADAAAIEKWLDRGGHLLALGLDGAEAQAFLPFKVQTRRGEHIGAHFEPAGPTSLLAGIGPADVHNRDPREIPLITGGAIVTGDGVLARSEKGNVVFCQFVPWQFDFTRQMNLKRTFRRVAFLVNRLTANMGAVASTPTLTRFQSPAKASEQRWLEGFYLDRPEEWDDPYRFFRW